MRHRYLRPALTMPQIYLYRAPIDFRKQVHGLAALVEQQLGHNPFTGALYAFTNAYFGLSGHLFRFHPARRFGVIRPA